MNANQIKKAGERLRAAIDIAAREKGCMDPQDWPEQEAFIKQCRADLQTLLKLSRSTLPARAVKS